MVLKIENLFFKYRLSILSAFVLLTIVMGFFASQLKLDAGFYKQLPGNHSFIKTFYQYEDALFGSNNLIIAVRNTEGDIFEKDFLSKLLEVSEAVRYLPGANQASLTSLWTPNVRVLRVTEEGYEATPVIPGNIIPEDLNDEEIEKIKERILTGGHVGKIVSNDFTSALIKIELTEFDARTGEALDYIELGKLLDVEVRNRFKDDKFQIHIIGFAKMISDIASQAGNVFIFFLLAFALTVLSVYYYSKSWTLTFLPLICSLTSLIWQFGMLEILGFGLDPLAILVPFLVFAIGVSHGIQQVNQITKEIIEGQSSIYAARASFSRLLVPGTMALITDLVGFGTLVFLPIGMIQELGITASIGVAMKIVTNLVMLPLAASYAKYNEGFVIRAEKAITGRRNAMKFFGKMAEPRTAFITLGISSILFVYATILASDRHIGDLHAGAPELRPDAVYNQDMKDITSRFNITSDVLIVIMEVPELACRMYDVMSVQDNFHWYMENVEGVTEVISLSGVARQAASGYAEGNPKWNYVPRHDRALGFVTSIADPSTGLLNENCTILPVYIFTEDHKATTIEHVINATKEYQNKYQSLDIAIDFYNVFLPPEGEKPYPNVLVTYGAEIDYEAEGLDSVIEFSKEEWIDFGYKNNFNTRSLGTPRLNAMMQDTRLDEIDTVLSREILAARKAITNLFNENPSADAIAYRIDDTNFRLASGTVGIMHATNEVIEESELPMMLLVYAVIVFLVFITYRDWRATICCTVPLTFATMLGYAFMDIMQIGLKISTLPVMVLAVGIGVDYAFYIYNRLQTYLKEGQDITQAFQNTFANTGAAVIFTALTLAIGVSTWSFSALKFQADMGMLLTFMFIVNMLCAMTTLPALAVVLDKLFPRKK
ncbi:efflux RND transporter permease subunit [Pelagibacteraceae bacterium]|jgi:predicted RND superfamily exporter protein|nr:efflux RND transporter permease subunit [Pelagibacteraceae bacterium]